MKRFILTFALFSLFALPARAAETVTIHVLGMVCEFCAESIFKVFEDSGAEDIQIDLDEKTVVVIMPDGKTISDEEIEKLIHFGGYDLEKIERSES